MEDIRAKREASFAQAAAGLDEKARSMLHDMLFNDPFYYGDIEWSGENGVDLVLESPGCESYRRHLTLCNASGLPEGDYVWLCFEDGELLRDGKDYILTGQTSPEAEGEQTPFAIRFSDAKAVSRVYRAGLSAAYDRAWDVLWGAAEQILYRADAEGPLNEKERALLPLLREIYQLKPWAFGKLTGRFPLLKERAARFGYRGLVRSIEKLEAGFFGKWKQIRFNQLTLTINRLEYEPLWRELFEQITDSQAEYPSCTEAECSPKLLKRVRDAVERRLHSYGYSGTYPDFYKREPLRGMHHTALTPYFQDYIVGLHKNTAYRIHCRESYCGELRLALLSGTELLRRGEEMGDIYSCMFHANGRRLLRETEWSISMDDAASLSKLERQLRIAVKRAELKNLDKDEQEKSASCQLKPPKKMLRPLLWLSGLWTVMWFALFMPLASLGFALMTGDIRNFTEILTDPIWLPFFPGTWLAMFLLMLICQKLVRSANRKK